MERSINTVFLYVTHIHRRTSPTVHLISKKCVCPDDQGPRKAQYRDEASMIVFGIVAQGKATVVCHEKWPRKCMMSMAGAAMRVTYHGKMCQEKWTRKCMRSMTGAAMRVTYHGKMCQEKWPRKCTRSMTGAAMRVTYHGKMCQEKWPRKCMRSMTGATMRVTHHGKMPCWTRIWLYLIPELLWYLSFSLWENYYFGNWIYSSYISCCGLVYYLRGTNVVLEPW